MKYTTDTPKETGFYWLKFDLEPGEPLSQVVFYGHGQRQIESITFGSRSLDEVLRLDNCRWCKIPKPGGES